MIQYWMARMDQLLRSPMFYGFLKMLRLPQWKKDLWELAWDFEPLVGKVESGALPGRSRSARKNSMWALLLPQTLEMNGIRLKELPVLILGTKSHAKVAL